MTYGGLNKKKMDAAAEIGRNPVISKIIIILVQYHIQPEYGDDEQADDAEEYNCRTSLARPNSQAPTGAGTY